MVELCQNYVTQCVGNWDLKLAAELPGPAIAPAGDPPRREEEPETPRAVISPSPNVPCERKTTPADFPSILGNIYRAAQENESMFAGWVIGEIERHGVKVK